MLDDNFHSIMSLNCCLNCFDSGCSFLSKAMEAEHAGAIAVIITDNDITNDDTLIEMITDGSSNTSNIPAFFMLGKDGYILL